MRMFVSTLPLKSLNLTIPLSGSKFYSCQRKIDQEQLLNLYKTRSARSPDNFVTYVLALLLGFPFTLLLSSADSEWRSHKRTHPTQICDRDTFYKQHTEKKKGNRKTIYWKLSDKNCQEVPRKILNLLPGELFCNSKNMALFLYVFRREPCF